MMLFKLHLFPAFINSSLSRTLQLKLKTFFFFLYFCAMNFKITSFAILRGQWLEAVLQFSCFNDIDSRPFWSFNLCIYRLFPYPQSFCFNIQSSSNAQIFRLYAKAFNQPNPMRSFFLHECDTKIQMRKKKVSLCWSFRCEMGAKK